MCQGTHTTLNTHCPDPPHPLTHTYLVVAGSWAVEEASHEGQGGTHVASIVAGVACSTSGQTKDIGQTSKCTEQLLLATNVPCVLAWIA
jgi:hypothetical protein